jgi:hypothetical protein
MGYRIGRNRVCSVTGLKSKTLVCIGCLEVFGYLNSFSCIPTSLSLCKSCMRENCRTVREADGGQREGNLVRLLRPDWREGGRPTFVIAAPIDGPSFVPNPYPAGYNCSKTFAFDSGNPGWDFRRPFAQASVRRRSPCSPRWLQTLGLLVRLHSGERIVTNKEQYARP